MADVIKNEEGQLMLLTVFMILIGVVTYTGILNSMIFSSNLQSTGLGESKQEIRDFRLLTEAEMLKAAYYANTTISDPGNNTQVLSYFLNHTKSFNDTITKIYSARGISVEVIINNVSLNGTTTDLEVNKFHVEWKPHNFSAESLVIPMDDNQSTDQSKLVRVYGLIYKTVDDKGPEGLLNHTRIPVWVLLQNPVNSSVPNFSSTMYTSDNASGAGINASRDYSGGPFIIEATDLDPTKRDLILNEAKNKSIVVHKLLEPFYYEKSVQMLVPPKIAMFPNDSKQNPIMEQYYEDGEVPVTVVNQYQVQAGILTTDNYNIVTVPHHALNTSDSIALPALETWVANGGILHAQCNATDSFDNNIEIYANNQPWYGFIGINKTSHNIDYDNGDYPKMTNINMVDNSTPFNATLSFNMSPPISRGGLADPGAPFDPLAQSANKSGILGFMGSNSLTPAFSLRSNGSQVNPETNIIGYASYPNGTPVYVGDDSNYSKPVPTFIYVEARYGNGLVSYLAGHNQANRMGGERLIFNNFFAASMKKQSVTGIVSKTINVTIKYFDGKVRYTDTFIINT